MAEQSNKMEMIGFHKGSITTLANERRELAKMINTVEQLIAAHVKALQDMGVKIVGEAPKSPSGADEEEGLSNEKMEDLLE